MNLIWPVVGILAIQRAVRAHVVVIIDRLLRLSRCLRSAIRLKEVVLAEFDNAVEDEVNDKKICGPVHASWINLVGSTLRTKPGNKGQKERQRIKHVHYDEVNSSSGFEHDSSLAREMIQNLIEADKVEVVWEEDEKEEACNELFVHVEHDQQNEANAIEG